MESITLQTNDTIVTSGDFLGQLQFAASSESDGGASQLVVARIYSQAEGAFSASSNPASIIFATSSSDALAASGKIKIDDNGNILPFQSYTYNVGTSGLEFLRIHAGSGYLRHLYFDTGIDIIDQVPGQLNWDTTQGTLDLGLTATRTTSLGQDVFFRVQNSTGSTLFKGQAVYASGVTAGGQRILAAKYVADNSIQDQRFIGIVTEDITNGSIGFVTHFGYIKKVDTRTTNSGINPNGEAWSPGDILFVHPTVAGGLTKTQPKYDIYTAFVLGSGVNGELFVRPSNPGDLTNLHDVSATGATNNQYLVYSTGQAAWIPTSSGIFTSLTLNNTGVPVGSGVNNYVARWIGTTVLTTGLLYDNGTNVAVGTGSPQAQFHVFRNFNNASILRLEGVYSQGNLEFYETGAIRGYIGYGDPGSLLPNQLSDSLAILGTNALHLGAGTGGSNAGITIRSTGNVGVGTNDPLVKFQVESGNIIFNNDGGDYDFLVKGDNDASLLFTDANVDRVGIGTNTPSYKLHVVGTGYITGDVIVDGNVTVNGTTTTVNVDRMEVEDPILTLGLASGNIVSNTSLDRGLALILSTGLTAFMGWDKSENEFSFLSSGVATSNSGIYSPGTYGNIHAAGFIGTSGNFSNGLVISGSATINGTGIVAGAGTSGYLAKWSSSSTITSGIVYESGSNVGIGTTTPSGKLHIVENSVSNSNLIIENAAAGAGISLIMRYAGTPYSGLIINDWVGDGFVFQASRDLVDSQGGFVWKGNNGTSHMVLRTNSTGKLGLGTTTPLQKFDVRGNIYTSGSMGIGGSSYSGNFPTNGLIVQGNVGIGTSSPVSKLQVSGLITANSGNFTNSLQLNGTGVSISGHTHEYNQILVSGANDITTMGLNASRFLYEIDNDGFNGAVNILGGISADNIFDFTSSVSGLIPVKNVTGSGYVNVSSSSGIYNIQVTGLQPSGNYANSTHSHGNITNDGQIGTVAGLVVTTDNSGVLIATAVGDGLVIEDGALVVDQPYLNSVYAAYSHIHGNITNSGTIGSASGLLVITGGNGILTTSSGINSSLISNFNSSVSGLLPVKNIVAGTNVTVSSISGIYTINSTASGVGGGGGGVVVENSGNDRILTSTGSSSGINAEANLTFNGSVLNVTGSGVFTSGIISSNFISNQSGTIIGTNGAIGQSGQMVFSQGSFSGIGDAQNSQYLLRGITSNSSWTPLKNNNTDAILLKYSRTYSFTSNILARSSTTSSNAAYKLEGLLYHDASGVAIVGTPIKTTIGENDSSWDVRVSISGAGTGGTNYLLTEVAGANAQTIYWLAKVDLLEIEVGPQQPNLSFSSAYSLTLSNSVVTPFTDYSYSGVGTSIGSFNITLGGVDSRDNRAWIAINKSGTLNYNVTASTEAGYDAGRLFVTSSVPSQHTAYTYYSGGLGPIPTGYTAITNWLDGSNSASGTYSVSNGNYLVLLYAKDGSADEGSDTISANLYIA